jgi:hypothetical protein
VQGPSNVGRGNHHAEFLLARASLSLEIAHLLPPFIPPLFNELGVKLGRSVSLLLYKQIVFLKRKQKKKKKKKRTRKRNRVTVRSRD